MAKEDLKNHERGGYMRGEEQWMIASHEAPVNQSSDKTFFTTFSVKGNALPIRLCGISAFSTYRNSN